MENYVSSVLFPLLSWYLDFPFRHLAWKIHTVLARGQCRQMPFQRKGNKIKNHVLSPSYIFPGQCALFRKSSKKNIVLSGRILFKI